MRRNAYTTLANVKSLGGFANFSSKADHCYVLSLAPGDYSHASGTILITDDDTTQCVNISIINDSEDEQDRECFAFAITTTTTEAISLETTQTTICISDDDGR